MLNLITTSKCFYQIIKIFSNAFEQFFTKIKDRRHLSRSGGTANVPIFKATKYGSNFITVKTAEDWNGLFLLQLTLKHIQTAQLR